MADSRIGGIGLGGILVIVGIILAWPLVDRTDHRTRGTGVLRRIREGEVVLRRSGCS
jgi:hypothetical protein